MSDNKKYYYMRLKENFFDTDSMILLESMQDGLLYSNILLKMYLKSLKCNGKLMLNEFIPYNAKMIATITRHQIGTVEKALQMFEQLGLIDILDNGTIYMSDIELMIGQSSTEGERKKRARIELKNKSIGQVSDKRPPEIEIELEKEIKIELEKEKELEIDITISKDIVCSTDVQRVVDAWNRLNDVGIKQISKLTAGTKRYESLIARIKQYGTEEVITAINKIRESDFLQGKKKNFVITFDWFVKPNNFPKVLEGNYDNDKGAKENGNRKPDNGLVEQAIECGIAEIDGNELF